VTDRLTKRATAPSVVSGMMYSRGHVRKAALLAIATAALTLLAATSALGQVEQTLKNGCWSPVAYQGSITSPAFNTGPNGGAVSLNGWFEVESVNFIDTATVEYSDDSSSGTWTQIGEVTPAADFPSGGASDLPWSNNGLSAEPSFEASGPFLIPGDLTGAQVRIRFATEDDAFQGYRGVGIDDIQIATGGVSQTDLFEGFDGPDPVSWTFDAPDPPTAGTPHWQVVSESDGIFVTRPEIDPDLVTLPDSGSADLPASGVEFPNYAWFGDQASGTYCGPDFANRFVPGQTGPTGPTGGTGQTGTGTTTPTIGQARRQTLADLPKPVLGKVANVEPVKGIVLVAIPVGKATAGSASVGEAIASQKGLKFVPLAEARQVPVGSFLDTRKGTVRLQAAATGAAKPYLGSFNGGLFQMRQSRKRKAKGLTDLVLKGGKFKSCAPQRTGKRGKRASAAISRKRLRRLKGSGKGRFRTRGRYSAATVRGTKWTVTDRCDGTLTQVSRGKVAVRDFRRKKTILLRAGKRYLARAQR
jgi:hypothetical protein